MVAVEVGVVSLITCPECNGKLSTTARACPHCGYVVPAPAPKRICPECQGEVEPNRTNCQRCGYVMTGAPAIDPLLQAPAQAGLEPPVRQIRVVCPWCRAVGLVGADATETECGGCRKTYDTGRGVALTRTRKRARVRPPPGEAQRRYDDTDDSLSLVFGIVGLFTCVILSLLAVKYGKPGSMGRTLGYVGIALWVLLVLAAAGAVATAKAAR